MPQDATCPKCKHSFPVTEARHAFTVACPRCEAELTAEFKKPSAPPEAGQPPYDLLVKPGAIPGTSAPPPVPRKKKDEDDEPKRKGGSAMIVLLSGGFGLMVVLGGLSLTGWFLFAWIDVDSTSTTRSNSSSSSGNKGSSLANPKIVPTPKGTPGKFTPPDFSDPFPPVTPKKDTFDLRPAIGSTPPISPPDLPTDPSNVDLKDIGGKVGAITVGGGGRYLVMHFPDTGKLGIFDVNTARVATVDSDNGEVKLAAGLTRAVVYAPNANILRVYSLPDLRKMYDTTAPDNGMKAIAMGSRTNGPLLCLTGWGDPILMELRDDELKEIDGSRKEHTGLHSHMLRAAPDGTAFSTFDGFHPHNKTTLLTVENRRWKVQKDIGEAPFPGTDGNFYGNGWAMNRSGRDQRFEGGVGAGSGSWFVPAVSGSGYFLKVVPTTIKTKRTMTVTVHSNRNASTPVAGTPTLLGMPEFDDLMAFGRTPSVPLDQHLFLMPEAGVLVTLMANKERLVIRRVNPR